MVAAIRRVLSSYLCGRPLLQYARPLPDGQPDPQPMLDRRGGDRPRLIQVAARVEHALGLGRRRWSTSRSAKVAAVRSFFSSGILVPHLNPSASGGGCKLFSAAE
jgi:hypothetical protein